MLNQIYSWGGKTKYTYNNMYVTSMYFTNLKGIKSLNH